MAATHAVGPMAGGAGSPPHGRLGMTAPRLLDWVFPPTFATSFWTYPDYRVGPTVLYTHIQEGLDENDSVLALVKHRAETERETARHLSHIPPPSYAQDPLFPDALQEGRDGIFTSRAPLARVFRQVASDTATTQADAHRQAAKTLETTIVDPLVQWNVGHSDRVHQSYQAVDQAVTAMERQEAEVTKLRTAYEDKCRQADETEDDFRFSPNSQPEAEEEVGGMRRLSLLAPRSTSNAKPAETNEASAAPPLDPQRLQRRETLRQQFGFKHRNEEEASAPPPETEPSGPTLQRSSSRLSTYLSRAVNKMGESPTLAQVRATVTGLGEQRHVRLRREAELAEQHYQQGVVQLGELRNKAEQVLFHQYQRLQRWEADRVTVLRKTLAGYARALHPVGGATQKTLDLARQIEPEAHLLYLMRTYRTGSFRPAPVVFTPYYHDDQEAYMSRATAGFGMDLVSMARAAALMNEDAALQGDQGTGRMPALPPILHALLSALQRSYADQTQWTPRDGSEASKMDIAKAKRNIWLYDVPLHVTHAFRARLIEYVTNSEGRSSASDWPIPDAFLDAVDAPVLAAAVKLWALELKTPLLPHSSWDEVAEIYDAAAIRHEAQKGAEDADPADVSKPILQGLRGVLARLPRLQLSCLDAWIAHLYKLIKDTPTDEDAHVYTTKLGLALGRAILRPTVELPSTAYAKYPALVMKDLVEAYESLFPPLLQTKAGELDATMLSPLKNTPRRRRAPLLDQRISRSSLQNARIPSDGLQRRAAELGPSRRSVSLMEGTPGTLRVLHGGRTTSEAGLPRIPTRSVAQDEESREEAKTPTKAPLAGQERNGEKTEAVLETVSLSPATPVPAMASPAPASASQREDVSPRASTSDASPLASESKPDLKRATHRPQKGTVRGPRGPRARSPP